MLTLFIGLLPAQTADAVSYTPNRTIKLTTESGVGSRKITLEKLSDKVGTGKNVTIAGYYKTENYSNPTGGVGYVYSYLGADTYNDSTAPTTAPTTPPVQEQPDDVSDDSLNPGYVVLIILCIGMVIGIGIMGYFLLKKKKIMNPLEAIIVEKFNLSAFSHSALPDFGFIRCPNGNPCRRNCGQLKNPKYLHARNKDRQSAHSGSEFRLL